jgi:hypothetical protein
LGGDPSLLIEPVEVGVDDVLEVDGAVGAELSSDEVLVGSGSSVLVVSGADVVAVESDWSDVAIAGVVGVGVGDDENVLTTVKVTPSGGNEKMAPGSVSPPSSTELSVPVDSAPVEFALSL